MTDRQARPYALKAGRGWTYNYGIDFTVKVGEKGQGRRIAIVEYSTRAGEEPPNHTHDTEDEAFYVLEGGLTIYCGGETFEVDQGGFVFLPCGLEHGYRIRSRVDVRLLVVTAPADGATARGWGGFIGDIEQQGEPRGSPPSIKP